MPRIKNDAALSREIREAEKAEPPRTRVSDGDNLYLLLSIKGGEGKAWRFDYSHDGKRKTLSLGTYPETSLVEARRKREEAQALVTAGIDPSTQRKAQRKIEKRKAGGEAEPETFRAVFELWHQTQSPGWSQSYSEKVKARIVNDVLPSLGGKKLTEIDAGMLLECLRRVQARGAIETAHSALQNVGQVFAFGIGEGLCRDNPASLMSGNLKPVIVRHQAAVTTPKAFERVMAAIGGYASKEERDDTRSTGTVITREALMLLAMTFQRPGNVRAMRWADLDLDAAMWAIPSMEMKRKKQAKVSGGPHFVPLCPEAVSILRELQPLTGRGEFVFQAQHTSRRPMSENTMNMALRRMGITQTEQTAHGFRSTAMTLLDEHLGFDQKIVDAQQAHGKPGKLGSTYNRSEYAAERLVMMNMWGRICSDCSKGLPFPKAAPVKAEAPAAPPAAPTMDAKALALMIERLTGTKPTAAAIRKELAGQAKGR
jgi:integrase